MTKIMNDIMKIKGTVISGEGIGTSTGYPTANISREHFDKNPVENGIYAARVRLDGSDEDLPGIAVIGVPPQEGEGPGKVEVHLLDFNEDIVGRDLEAKLIQFIRPLEKFSSPQDLLVKMNEDEISARSILNKNTSQ